MNLKELVCDVDCWLSGRVSALHSVVQSLREDLETMVIKGYFTFSKSPRLEPCHQMA